MAKKPAEPEIPTFFSPADIAAESERGQTIRDNPLSMLPTPALPQWGEPDVQTRDRVMAALQGFGKSQEAAARVAGLGDPVSAALAAIAGAAGAPDPQAIANQRQDLQRQALLARFEAAPVETVSPDLVKAHPELRGIPLKYVHQIAPILERDAKSREAALNPAEQALYAKIAAREPIKPEDLNGVRGQHVTAAAMAAAGKPSVDPKRWDMLSRLTNPTVAPRGSLLGQAGMGNARADRALTTLNSDKVTPQQISAVVADYAGIMQGGAPHETALRQMGYSNLANDWANLIQRITSKPQDANQPEVLSKLRQMVQEIKDVDNQIIQQNLDAQEIAHSDVIAADPERWDRYKAQILKGTKGVGDRKGGAAAAPVYSKTAINPQSGQRMGLNPITGKWEVVQ